MIELLPFFIFDIFLVFMCIFILRKSLSFIHPFTLYVFLHIYIISIRIYELLMGATPMYGNSFKNLAIESEEFIRAIILADYCLFSFFLGCYLSKHLINKKKQNREVFYRRINYTACRDVLFVCFPIGLIFFVFNKQGTVSGSYTSMFSQWFASCLLIYFYIKGVHKTALLVFLGYIFIVLLQGYHRTQGVLPLLFFISIYLLDKNLKWPPKYLLVLGACFVLIFPQLKIIGQSYQGNEFDKVGELVSNSFDINNTSESSMQLLDQFSGALTLRDQYGQFFYGDNYLALITLPIPRSIWEGKPKLGENTRIVATYERPYDKEGRIVTYIGDVYFNFGYYGVFIAPFLISWFLSIWYYKINSLPNKNIDTLMYLVFYCALVQVYRDGLTAFILFTVMTHTPIFLLSFYHKFTRKERL